MPKVAKHVLTWLPERSVYELRGPNGVNEQPIQGEDEKWFTRLSTLSSFAFRGQHGNLTLRKEDRTSGEGYWYAYRSQHQQTFKRYAGRTADLTITRLEEIARAFAATMSGGSVASHEEHITAATVPALNALPDAGISRDVQEPIFSMVPISSLASCMPGLVMPHLTGRLPSLSYWQYLPHSSRFHLYERISAELILLSRKGYNVA